jgi:hypothetical protein
MRFVSSLGCWDVKIPIIFCFYGCGTAPAHPLQCGCFPGACEGAGPAAVQHRRKPVWFDDHALLHIFYLRDKSLEPTDEAAVETLNRMCAEAQNLTPPQARFRTEQHKPTLTVRTIT